MSRIAGVNIPDDKHIGIALQYIFGIGKTRAKKIVEKANVNFSSKVSALTEDEKEKVRKAITDLGFKVEGDLRRIIAMDIKRLVDINCYRGIRHKKGLPVRGQRTRTNARTRKSKKSRSSSSAKAKTG